MAQGLTVKQEKFCNKYLECGNASEAYRFAYDAENMKYETIKRKACALLENPRVKPRISKLQAKTERKAEIKRMDVVRLLSDAIMADVTDYVDPIGNVKVMDIRDMPIENRRLIEKIEATKDGVKITLMSKTSAIERLSKMLGWDAPMESRITDARVQSSPLNGLSVDALKKIRDIANGE